VELQLQAARAYGQHAPDLSIEARRAVTGFSPMVAIDGRMHPRQQPFRTLTGRNAPGRDHIMTRPRWLRGLINAGPGRALALLDWRYQELAIAATLARDDVLWRLVSTDLDAYGEVGAAVGLTRIARHSTRAVAKSVALAWLNGAGPRLLGKLAGTEAEAGCRLAHRFDKTFAGVVRWRGAVAEAAAYRGVLETRFGWRWHATGWRPGQLHPRTTAWNFPIQAAGAEMMRIATVAALERGVAVCTPVHDAFLIEATRDGIDAAAGVMRSCMDFAARAVLGGGREIGVAVRLGACGEELLDLRDQATWRAAMACREAKLRDVTGRPLASYGSAHPSSCS
jgi:DNA polymerase I-like protein with 3'-5' exonuclease and polymerase domains